jgi:hypothetical protein
MNSQQAYFIALKNGPSDETRRIACEVYYFAYFYALDVDKGPCDDTRQAACKDPSYAYWYAQSVDKGPRATRGLPRAKARTMRTCMLDLSTARTETTPMKLHRIIRSR